MTTLIEEIREKIANDEFELSKHAVDQSIMLVQQEVTYTLEMDGKFFLIENVPARVNIDTGEQFFSLETVERLQQIILNSEEPIRVIETPVYNFAA